MSQNLIEMISRVTEWMAMPFVYFSLGLVFFLFIVKPFFLFVFDPDRVASHNAAEEVVTQSEAAKELDDLIDGEDLLIEPGEDIPDILTDDQKLAMLATSSPEKGQVLVKEWLGAEQKNTDATEA